MKNRFVRSGPTIVQRCEDGTFYNAAFFHFSWEAKIACNALNAAWREKDKKASLAGRKRSPTGKSRKTKKHS